MSAKQARGLLVGTIVMWEGNPADLGTVRQIGRRGAYIDWENGVSGWLDFQDMAQVSIR
jgi:ribosomal protein S1